MSKRKNFAYPLYLIFNPLSDKTKYRLSKEIDKNFFNNKIYKRLPINRLKRILNDNSTLMEDIPQFVLEMNSQSIKVPLFKTKKERPENNEFSSEYRMEKIRFRL